MASAYVGTLLMPTFLVFIAEHINISLYPVYLYVSKKWWISKCSLHLQYEIFSNTKMYCREYLFLESRIVNYTINEILLKSDK